MKQRNDLRLPWAKSEHNKMAVPPSERHTFYRPQKPAKNLPALWPLLRLLIRPALRPYSVKSEKAKQSARVQQHQFATKTVTNKPP